MMRLALLIILTHSIVPHHHAEGGTAAVCIAQASSTESDLLDRLGEVFHLDLGADHLENWVNSNGLEIVLPYFDAQPAIVEVIPLLVEVYVALKWPNGPPLPDLTSVSILSSLSHRGPPLNIRC